MKDICVVACHFNPCGYRLPEENFLRFSEHMRDSRVDFYTIELRFDDQKPRQSYVENPRHHGTSLWCGSRRHLIWQKEALLGVLLKQVVDQYDAVAWVDADVLFMRRDWADATLRELECCQVVQMFSQANQLDGDAEVDRTVRSMAWHWSTRHECWNDFAVAHPGYAWAARSEILKKHGLYPYMVTGCGDTAMVHGFVNDTAAGFDGDIGKAAMKHLSSWAKGVYEDVQGDVGFVMGSVVHLYHGERKNRQNRDRRFVMREIIPDLDLKINDSGLLEWTDNALKLKPVLVRAVANYFQSRQEDGTVQGE